MSPIPGIIGSLLATETIKVLIKSPDVLNNKILYYNALTNSMRIIKTKRKVEKCSLCKRILNNSSEEVIENNVYYSNIHIIKWNEFIKIINKDTILFDVRNQKEIDLYGFKKCITYNMINPKSLKDYCLDNNIKDLYLICKNGKQSNIVANVYFK